MAQLNYGFSAGVDEATIATSDTGSGDAFDTILITSPGTLKYDNARANPGVMSGRVVASTATSGLHLEWSTKLGTVTDHYGRIYLNFDVLPATASRNIATMSGGNNGAQIRVKSGAAGTVELLDGLNAIQATSTTAITVDSWFRLEWHIIHSTTVGQIIARIYLNPAASSASYDQEVSTAANINTRANADLIRFGTTLSSPSGYPTFWIGQISANATGWLGPVDSGIPFLAMASYRAA